MLSPALFNVLKDSINNKDDKMFITIKAASLLAQISDLSSDNTLYPQESPSIYPRYENGQY